MLSIPANDDLSMILKCFMIENSIDFSISYVNIKSYDDDEQSATCEYTNLSNN